MDWAFLVFMNLENPWRKKGKMLAAFMHLNYNLVDGKDQQTIPFQEITYVPYGDWTFHSPNISCQVLAQAFEALSKRSVQGCQPWEFQV